MTDQDLAVLGYLIALVVAVDMIVAQCQLFAIKRYLRELTEMQRRQMPPEPTPQATPADYRRICDPL
jgi:hypothetical protein